MQHSNQLDKAHLLNSLNSNVTKGDRETSQLHLKNDPLIFRQRLMANYQSDGDVAQSQRTIKLPRLKVPPLAQQMISLFSEVEETNRLVGS